MKNCHEKENCHEKKCPIDAIGERVGTRVLTTSNKQTSTFGSECSCECRLIAVNGVHEAFRLTVHVQYNQE